MTKYTIYEEDDTSTGLDLVFFSFILSILMTILAVIVSIFGAFIAVGVVWGTFKSIFNYIKGAIETKAHLGHTIEFAWRANVLHMQYFFNLANCYDGILAAFVKTFLVMAGVGVISIGTILLPVWIVIHSVIQLIIFPFHLASREREGASKVIPDKEFR